MGNKTTVEVTEQTLYNIDILEDETTVVTIEVPQDIVTVEVSQFTVSLELYNSDNDVEGQPVYAKSGSDFTLRSFTDDDKTIDISHAGPSTELIQVKLPDSGIRVKDGFVISTDSDDTANITFNGSNIDIYGVDDIAVSNLVATNATITTGTVTTLDGDTLDYNTGSIDDLTSTNITTTNVDATLATVTTGNITTINSTTITNTGDLDVGGEANVAGNLAVTLDTTIGGNTAISGNATITQDVSANNAYITNNITASDIDTDTGSIDVLNVVTATASDEFVGDIRGAVRFRAKAGEQLFKGQVVYVSGVSGNTPVVNKADASDPSKMPAYGLVFADANDNSNVEIVTFGALQGLNTENFSLGTIWVSTTPGSLTQVKPTDPTHLIQNIGRVKRVHQSAGAIIVGGAGRTNDVPNEFSILGNIATAANMSANNITITNDITTDDLTGNQATITDITATTINTDTIDANTGNITTVNATTVNTVDNNVSNLLVAPVGNITTVNATDVNTTNLATTLITADTGNITTVNATTVNTVDISATGNADVTGNTSIGGTLIVTNDATLSSDVVVSGNLTVNGTTTTVNTETLEVADNNIVLNSNHTGTPTQDAGFTVERGDADDAVFQWNETTDKFEVKVGTADAVIKAGDLESVNLTATQATITTGDFTTVNSTDVNSTNLDVDTGSIDALTSITVDATTGNITTVNATTVNTTDLNSTGTATLETANVNQLNTDSIDVSVITGLQGLSVTGNINTQRLNASWGNFTNLVNVGSLDVGGGDLTVDINGNLVGLSGEFSDTVSGDTVRANYLRETTPGGGIDVIDDLDLKDVVRMWSTTYADTLRISDRPDDFYNKTKYGAFITPDGILAQTLDTDRAVHLATETGNVRIGSRLLDSSTPSLATLGQHKNNPAALDMYGLGPIIWNDSSVDPDIDVSLSIHPTGHHLIIDSAEGVEIAAQIRGNLVPHQNLTYDLGSRTKQWHSAFIGPGSLYIEGQKVIGSTDGTINFTTDDDENMSIFAGGDGTEGTMTIGSAGLVTNIQDATVNLGPVGGAGTTYVRNTLNAPTLHNGDLELSGTLINQTTANQNLEIRTNGTGYLHANVADLYVGPLSGALKIDENSLSLTAGGNLAIQNNTDITGDLDVSGLITVNDGFTLGSFNPYAAFGGTAMPTTIMGAGQESGWSAMTVRSRGEHDWGLSGFGISPEAPRALFVAQAGRLDGSNDDYLNSGDVFSQFMMNPYSGYRTGVEWLTPSAVIEAEATENHSSSGMGTKLVLRTTTNGSFAGATDSGHTDGEIAVQGTTITTNGTLKLDDDVQITGELTGNGAGTLNIGSSTKITGNAASKTTTIGDATVSGGLYNTHGFKVEAGATAWASVILDEYVGGNDKPAPAFTNPSIVGQVTGGTPSSPEAVPSGKRLFVVAGQGTYDNGGSIEFPPTSPFRMVAETTENHTSTGRGTKLQIETTENGTTNKNTILFQGNVVNINAGGGDGVIRGGNNLKLGSNLDTANQNIINSGGDVTVDDNLKVNNNLTVDGTTTLNGNATIGNDNTADFVQINARVDMNGLFGLINIDTATANYYAGLENAGYITMNAGSIVYVTDGDGGNPCVAFYDGTNWKRMHNPSTNISAT